MYMSLNNRLKEIRNQKGLTQETLARAVGVTRQTIIAVEQGRYVPSVKLALELSAALDSPLEQVFWLGNKEGDRS
jgi:putative transcriptional regulator